MLAEVAAISLTELVERVGTYVGLAAFLGLAILTLLYFSQARDVRRLREWAGRAPERAEEGAAQHHLPPTPIAAGRRPRKPLLERVRGVHIPQLRYLAIIAGAAVILAGAVLGALQLTGGDGPDRSKAGHAKRTRAERGGKPGSQPSRLNVDPAQVTVAVLNGTTIAGLAAQVGKEVQAGGFTLGTVTNAGQTDQAGSEVLYHEGQKAEGRAVGDLLGIRTSAPVDSLSAELAGSADVVVLVGSDRGG